MGKKRNNVVATQQNEAAVTDTQHGDIAVIIAQNIVVSLLLKLRTDCVHVQLDEFYLVRFAAETKQLRSFLTVSVILCAVAELRDFEPDIQQEIEVDEGNTAVIECHLPESQPKAQVRYSVKQEWLETSKGTAPRSHPASHFNS